MNSSNTTASLDSYNLRYKKLDVAINVGDERVNPVKIGAGTFFPDLVLSSGKKLAGLVEVETGESVNNLEAMAQWVHFSRARVPFHLYVPVPGYDAARRLCEANGAKPSEIWTYRPTNDGFDLVRIYHEATTAMAPVKSQAPAKAPAPAAKKPAAAKPPKATLGDAREGLEGHQTCQIKVWSKAEGSGQGSQEAGQVRQR